MRKREVAKDMKKIKNGCYPDSYCQALLMAVTERFGYFSVDYQELHSRAYNIEKDLHYGFKLSAIIK